MCCYIIYKSQIDSRILALFHAATHILCWHFNHCFPSFITGITLVADCPINWRDSTEFTKRYIKVSDSESKILPLEHGCIIGNGIRKNRRVFRFVNFLLRFKIR